MQSQTEQEAPQTQWQPLAQQSAETNTADSHRQSAAELDAVKAQSVVMKLKRQARTRWHLNFVYAAVLMIAFAGMASNTTAPAFWQAAFWVFVSLASALFYLVTWLQMRQANKAIALINDVAMVGPLAEALDTERFLKPKAVVAALRRLLPRLQASDADRLTRAQRACLYRAINRQPGRSFQLYDKGLAADICHALQQIGDRDALPQVQRAAKWSLDRRIRDEANDCLPFLLEKAEAHKRGEQYLRPSSALAVPNAASDALLRPAAGVAGTAAEELLRPGAEQPPIER